MGRMGDRLCAVAAAIALISAAPSNAQTRQENLASKLVRIEENGTHTFLPASLPFQTTVGVGFDYNRGDYGESKSTTIGSITPSLNFAGDVATLRISLPYFQLEGPINPNLPGSTKSEEGIGDLLISASYTLYPPRANLPFFDFTVKVKVPTAGEDLGTQETDVSLVANVTHQFESKFIFFADLGYRVRGGGDYDNTLLMAVGGGVQSKSNIGFWLVYDWREEPFADRGDDSELTPFLSIPFGANLHIDPYMVIGLAKASPDWGLGTSVSWKF